jgi:hypothetical protein
MKLLCQKDDFTNEQIEEYPKVCQSVLSELGKNSWERSHHKLYSYDRCWTLGRVPL